MSSSSDNLFYEYFRKNYPVVFSEVQGSRKNFPSNLCIPPSQQFEYVIQKFGQNRNKMLFFLHSHILRLSTYYADLYVSRSGTVFLKKERNLISVKGFNEGITAKIIREDEFYNSSFEPIKVWYIDKCLINGSARIENRSKHFEMKCDPTTFEKLETLNQMKDNLKSYDPKVYKKIINLVKRFSKSYMILSCEDQVFDKLNNYCQVLLQQYKRKLSVSLQFSVRSVLESGVYLKIMNFLNEEYIKKDQRFLRSCELLRRRKLKDYNIPPRLQAPQDESISILRRISKFTNHLEKINCVKQCLDQIFECITNNRRNEENEGLEEEEEEEKLDGEKRLKFSTRIDLKVKNHHQQITNSEKKKRRKVVVTTDNLIPLLSYVIVQARISDLRSQIEYMNKTKIEEIKNSEFDFALCSFQAAFKFVEKESRESNRKMKKRRKDRRTKRRREEEEEDEFEDEIRDSKLFDEFL